MAGRRSRRRHSTRRSTTRPPSRCRSTWPRASSWPPETRNRRCGSSSSTPSVSRTSGPSTSGSCEATRRWATGRRHLRKRTSPWPRPPTRETARTSRDSSSSSRRARTSTDAPPARKLCRQRARLAAACLRGDPVLVPRQIGCQLLRLTPWIPNSPPIALRLHPHAAEIRNWPGAGVATPHMLRRRSEIELAGDGSETEARAATHMTIALRRLFHRPGVHSRVLAFLPLVLCCPVIPATGQSITEFPVPLFQGTFSSAVQSITSGPDGALWFTELGASRIGRITTAGVISEFTVPTTSSGPFGIAAGPDGELWFTEGFGNKVGRITTSGTFAEFTIPTATSAPARIAAGPDGALWFAELGGDKIGRITTAGALSEFNVPTAAAGPSGITAGPDGALWFTEFNGSKIGRIMTAGVLDEFVVPTPSSFPFGITAGPDGARWFTETGVNKIGRITTGLAPIVATIPVLTLPRALLLAMALAAAGFVVLTLQRA